MIIGAFSSWFYTLILHAGFKTVEQHPACTRVPLSNLVKKIYKRSSNLTLVWLIQLSCIGLSCFMRGDWENIVVSYFFIYWSSWVWHAKILYALIVQKKVMWCWRNWRSPNSFCCHAFTEMSAIEQIIMDTGIISFWAAALFFLAQTCFIASKCFVNENATNTVKLHKSHLLFWQDLLFCENMYGKSYSHKARTSFSLQRLIIFFFQIILHILLWVFSCLLVVLQRLSEPRLLTW